VIPPRFEGMPADLADSADARLGRAAGQRPWRWPASAWSVSNTAWLLVGAVLAATGAAAPPVSEVDPDRITQISVINALLLGRFEGTVPFAALLTDGDFGLGTLDALDGELVVLDGRGYQIKSDGAVVEVGPRSMIPFAVVTPFGQDGELPCPAADSLAGLERAIDAAVGHPNNFVAIRIDADLASATLRSVHPQSKPYRPINARKDFQSVWTREDLRGTFVGIRSPVWAQGVTVPGFHWHFLAADRRSGGHVLDCHVRGGTIRFDICGSWLVKLDESADFNGVDLSADMRDELERIERIRGPRPATSSAGPAEPR
jgi:acetolactate decarboxylase